MPPGTRAQQDETKAALTRIAISLLYFPRQMMTELWHYAEAVKPTQGGANFPRHNRDKLSVLKRRTRVVLQSDRKGMRLTTAQATRSSTIQRKNCVTSAGNGHLTKQKPL